LVIGASLCKTRLYVHNTKELNAALCVPGQNEIDFVRFNAFRELQGSNDPFFG